MRRSASAAAVGVAATLGPVARAAPPGTLSALDPAEHYAICLGIYSNFTAVSGIVLEAAVEASRKPRVRFDHVTTISLGDNKRTIAHLVNAVGEVARPGSVRQPLIRYPFR